METRLKSFSVVLKIRSYIKIQISFRDRSFTWFLNYFLAKFLEILKTGSLEMGKFLRRQPQFFNQLRMRCINWVPQSVARGFLRFISFENKQCVNQLLRI